MDLREVILSQDDIPSELLDVPEWGVKVEVRGLTGRERAQLVQPIADTQHADMRVMYGNLVILGTYDPETGLPVFSRGDEDALLGKSGAAVERVALRVMELSGLTEDALNRAGKDSSTPSNDSPTSLPKSSDEPALSS